jgi:hypothetical protein
VIDRLAQATSGTRSKASLSHKVGVGSRLPGDDRHSRSGRERHPPELHSEQSYPAGDEKEVKQVVPPEGFLARVEDQKSDPHQGCDDTQVPDEQAAW